MRTGASSGPSKRYWRAGVFVSLTTPTLTAFSYVSDPGPPPPTPGSRTSPPHSHTAFTGCWAAAASRRLRARGCRGGRYPGCCGPWIRRRGEKVYGADGGGRQSVGAVDPSIRRRISGRRWQDVGGWAGHVRGIGRAGPRSGAISRRRRDSRDGGRPGCGLVGRCRTVPPDRRPGPAMPSPRRVERARESPAPCDRNGRAPFRMRPDGADQARAHGQERWRADSAVIG